MTDILIQQVSFISEAIAWQGLLAQFEYSDFYHTFDYVYLESLRINGAPKLVVVNMPSGLVGLIMIFRKIPGDNKYFDATAVYGYNGVLTSPALTPADFHLGIAQIKKALAVRGCVCFFNRESAFTSHRLPEATAMGNTVAVDLQQSPSAYDQSLAEGHRQEIKSLTKLNYTVTNAQSEKQLAEFKEIYYQTMQRRNARVQYFFSQKYFKAILENVHISTVLKIVYQNNQILAGSIFTTQGTNLHYLFSGSVYDAAPYPVTKLILDQMIRENLQKDKLKYLHLGGGLAGKNDGLFKFKFGFGKVVLPFYTTQWILLPEVYTRLSAHVLTETSFFPKYRSA
jgi:lipid II:glycine glycyltransferase (peptidoglycan interpeptide bridge formation enzyme)